MKAKLALTAAFAAVALGCLVIGLVSFAIAQLIGVPKLPTAVNVVMGFLWGAMAGPWVYHKCMDKD